MDNASKALIMAGAILIAVALVGVGVYLYSNAAGQVDNASDQLSAAEIQLKNSEFEAYEDSAVKGSEIKTLIRKVKAFNKQGVFPNGIKINSGDVDSINVGNISNGSTHVVTMHYDNDGYVCNIEVTNLTNN